MDALAGKPIFRIEPPPYVTDEIVEFVRDRVAELPKSPKLPENPN
jgi:hypothetical protein